MAFKGASVVDNLFKSVDELTFPSALRHSLSDVIQKSDNLADDLKRWRDDMLNKGDDLSTSTRRFIQSPSFVNRIDALPALEDLSRKFDDKLMNSSGRINLDGMIDDLSANTSLSAGDIEGVRKHYDAMYQRREQAVLAAMDSKRIGYDEALADVQKFMRSRSGSGAKSAMDDFGSVADEGAAASKKSNSADDYASRWTNTSGTAQSYARMKRFTDRLKGSDNIFAKGAGSVLSTTLEAGRMTKYATGAVTAGFVGVMGLHYLTDKESTKWLANSMIDLGESTADLVQDVAPQVAEKIRAAAPSVINATLEVMSLPGSTMATAVQEASQRAGLDISEAQSSAAVSLISGDPLFAVYSMASGTGMTPEKAAQIAVEAVDSGDVTKYFADKMNISEDQAAKIRENYDGVVQSTEENIAEITKDDASFRSFTDGLIRRRDQELADDVRQGNERRTLTDHLNALNLGGVDVSKIRGDISSWSTDTVSDVFNMGVDHADKLGLNPVSSFMFKVVAAVASGVSMIFGKSAGAAVQRWALDQFEVDDKIAALRDNVENNTVVSQLGDRFGVGGRSNDMELVPS